MSLIKPKAVTSEFLTTDGTKTPPAANYDALTRRVVNAADPVNPQDLVTLAFLAAVQNRRDHSVNGASVDNFRSRRPIMRTKTNVNPAGGYTGGGTGNKSILGYYLPGPPYPAGGSMPLGALASIEYTVNRISPEVAGTNVVTPYVNLMVQLTPGLVVVMVLADWSNAVPTGVFTPPFPPVVPVAGPDPNLINMVWTPATGLVLVVNFEGMATPPVGPAFGLWAPIVTPSFGPPPSYALPVPPNAPSPSPGNWPGTGYKIGGGGPTDILTAYPGAIILNVDPADGGLPKTTVMSGITLNLGSSGNLIQSAVEVLDWKVNGAPV